MATRSLGPTGRSPVADIEHLVRVAAADADVGGSLFDVDGGMLSPEQLSVLFWLTRMQFRGVGNIAELGAYTGGTTRIFGEALKRSAAKPSSLEVYDLFEHNDTSRRRLRGSPGYEEDNFFEIWRNNTSEYATWIELHRGDFVTTSEEATTPLEILYVDIVKHPVLINPLMHNMMSRLVVGGYLIHQDYFHWQSPWVVYTTEMLIDHLDIVGTVSNHMLIAKLRSALPDAMFSIDYLASPSRAERIKLMRTAADRFPGIRRGLLRVSLMNLAMDWEEFDFDAEDRAIREDFSPDSRVVRYLDAVVKHRGVDDRSMW